MSSEDYITYIFAWHAHGDELTCEKCRHLNGREWREQDIFQQVLWDPIGGDVWNLDEDHSVAHGKGQYNCRCQLTVRVEIHIEKIPEYVTFNELLERFFW